MRPNTYCQQCRKATGMRACIHCKLKSKLFLEHEFNAIIKQPDMLSFLLEIETWYLYKDSN